MNSFWIGFGVGLSFAPLVVALLGFYACCWRQS